MCWNYYLSKLFLYALYLMSVEIKSFLRVKAVSLCLVTREKVCYFDEISAHPCFLRDRFLRERPLIGNRDFSQTNK